MRRAAVLVVPLVVALVAMVWPAGAADGAGFSGTFVDDDRSAHESAIEAIAAEGITTGCNPPANTDYCPERAVTRAQMAAFLHRALGGVLPESGTPGFTDDDGSIFENDIEWLAEVGVTVGCNPPSNTRFCPDQPVTRGQMAAFLVRATGLSDRGDTDFVDDDGSVFEADIERLAAAGITRGCNPPTNDRYCPNRMLTRAQMATFLTRALGYEPVPPVVDLATGWSCAKDGVECSGSASSRPGRSIRISEGWDHATPFVRDEESVFRSGATTFQLRIDGTLVDADRVDAGGTSIATRRWTSDVTVPSDSFVLEGRWIWDGELVRRTRVVVTVDPD